MSIKSILPLAATAAVAALALTGCTQNNAAPAESSSSSAAPAASAPASSAPAGSADSSATPAPPPPPPPPPPPRPARGPGREPRVRMLAERTERHLGARMPRTRLTREPIPLTQQRHVSRIQTIRHRLPLRRRQVQPRRPFRTPRRRGSPAQRDQRHRHARIVRIDNECQRIPAALTRDAQHLLEDATPLGHGPPALERLGARSDQHRHGVRTIRTQGAGACE